MADGNNTTPPVPGHPELEIQPYFIDPFEIYPITQPFKSENNRMIDPFEATFPPLTPVDKGNMSELRNSSVNNGTEDTGFQYKQFYVTRIVMIPCLVMMLLFSLMIVYIIIRHLRAIMKLYLSVIFYAFSILYFAALLVVLLVYNKVGVQLLKHLPDYIVCFNLEFDN